MLRIKIDNMNCGGCGKGVRSTLLDVAPDAKPQFDFDAREVRIEALDVEPILAALLSAGWQAREAPG